MKVKDLVVSKIELAYDLCEKYQSENPFNNGVMNEDLKSFFSKEFFDNVIDECDDESEKIDEIRASLEQFHKENIGVDIEFFWEIYATFQNEEETEYNLNDSKISREEYESCTDIKEFDNMMQNVEEFKLTYGNIGANLVDSRF